MFLIIILSIKKAIQLYNHQSRATKSTFLDELKKVLSPDHSLKKNYLFYIGVSAQLAYLIVLMYANYPVVSGRSNYYLALKIAASITTLCASLAITNKSSLNSKKTV